MIRAFVLLLVFVFHPGLSLAQTVVAEARVNEVDALIRDVNAAVESIPDATSDDAALIELNRRLVAFDDLLVDEGAELSDRLIAVRTRLEQIGAPPPPDGIAEPEPLTNERNALERERAEINQLIGRLEQASVTAKQATDTVSEARRDLFATTLTRRYDLRVAFGSQLFEDLADRWDLVERRLGAWATFTWRAKQQAVLSGLFVSALIGLAGAYLFRRLFGRLVARDLVAEQPRYFSRLTTGFGHAVLPTAATIVLLLAAYFVFEGFGLLRPDVANLLGSLIGSILIIVLVWRLAEALFSPSRPAWRIVGVADRAAGPLKALMIGMALVTVADFMLTRVNDIVGHAQTITIAKSLITSILTGGLLIAIAWVRPFERQDEQDFLHAHGGRWSPLMRTLFIGLGALLIVTALVGYIGFARFAAQQTVITGTVLITALLGMQAARATAAPDALAESGLGRWLEQRGASDVQIDQLGLVLGIVFGLIIVIVTIPLLALLWGSDPLVVGSWFAWFFTGIKIGSITLSITSILTGILLFAFGYWATRRLQNSIDQNVLERSRVETGARNSIRTAIGYVGIALAALLGVSAAGLELSQLALVAGALSLGIGFGLQNIVNNFVSGLILLAERPFKSGDIIEAGGYTGTVKTINVRATEVELFDRKTIILPNSELINSAVSNWMHKNPLGRLEVPIGVAYGTDPQLVIDTLMEIVNDHPRILANPEPFVAFVDFGASSLDFVLYGYIADVSFGLATRTELRLEIVKRFDVLGIEIPFPQRDVNLKIMGEQKPDKKTPVDDDPVFDIIKTSKTPVNDDD